MLKLLPNPYVLIAIGITALSLFLYIRFLQARVDHWKGQHDQVSATLNIERATHKQAMDEAEERAKRNLTDATDRAKKNVEHLQERIDFHATRAGSLSKRLRDAEASRLRPLAPAADSPSECRDYEADPTRLSGPDREFLIGEAAAAEEQGELLKACRADYEVVKLACGIR